MGASFKLNADSVSFLNSCNYSANKGIAPTYHSKIATRAGLPEWWQIAAKMAIPIQSN